MGTAANNLPPTYRSVDAVRAALAEVRAVYAELDRRPVERACTRLTECCQFKRTGQTPSVTRGEAMLAIRAFKATGRKEVPPAADGNCPMFEARTGKCLIYADRPFGCRTHFCAAAGGAYSRKEVLDLIRRLEEIDVKLGHRDGPRPFTAALAAEQGGKGQIGSGR